MKTRTSTSRITNGFTASELHSLGAKYESKKKIEVAALNYVRAAKAGSEEAASIFHFDSERTDEMHVDPERLAIIKEAAHIHYCDAEFSYGARYYYGVDVKKNRAIGFFWMDRAAKQGHPDAIFHVAEMYRKGEAVPRDTKRADLMTFKAAMEGSAPAEYRIGKQILFESNSDRQDKIAFQWILSAAERGCRQAKFDAGNMLIKGIGTTADVELGKEFIRQSGMSQTENSGMKMTEGTEGAVAF